MGELVSIFKQMYGRNLLQFTDPHFDFETLKRCPTLCRILEYRAAMAQQDSFSDETVSHAIDKEFNVLFEDFKLLWQRRNKRNALTRLESLPEVANIDRQMRRLMVEISRRSKIRWQEQRNSDQGAASSESLDSVESGESFDSYGNGTGWDID